MTVRIHASPDALADAVADEVEGWLALPDPIRTIGLAGGSTPRAAYEQLRQRSIAWREVHAWMTDERHVPVDDEESNAGMVRRALFDHVAATLHEVPWRERATDAADAYAEELAGFLPPGPGGPQPGLVLLGVGEDGHTASLFPGGTALEDAEHDYVAVEVPGRGWRLTATLGLLARARRTIFIVSGSHKAEVVAAVIGGDTDLPAAIVARHSRDPVWLLDRDAAGLL